MKAVSFSNQNHQLPEERLINGLGVKSFRSCVFVLDATEGKSMFGLTRTHSYHYEQSLTTYDPHTQEAIPKGTDSLRT